MTQLMKPLFNPRRWLRRAGLWAGVIAGVVSVILLVWIAVPYSVVVLIAPAPPILWSGVRVWLVPPCLFIAAALSRLWSGVRVWLVPPYFFIAIHLIIVVIWKLSERKARADRRLEDEKPPPAAEVPVADKPQAVAEKVLPVVDPVELEAATPVTVPKSGGSVPEPSSDASRLTTEVPVADKPRAVAENVLPVVDPVELEAATPVTVPKSGGSVPEPSSDASRLTTESDAMSTASSRVEIKKSVEVPTPNVESPAEGDDDESLEARWTAIKAADTAPVVRSPSPEAEADPPPANGLEPGPEEMNRRYDAFIQKNYDQRAEPVAAVHGHG